MPRRGVTDRDSLVRTAAALVSGHGVAGVRLADVATAAGVSVGTVYNHFPSKDHLLDAVAHQLEEEFVSAMAIAAPAERSLRDCLPDLVRTVLAVAARSPSVRVLSERAGARQPAEGEAPLLRGWIARRVTLAQKAGEVGAVDPGLVADLGFALLSAAITSRASDEASAVLLIGALQALLPPPENG